MNILELYTFSDFKSECIKEDPYYIEGKKFFLSLSRNNINLTTSGKEICFVLIDENTLKLDYIGIKEEYRGGILKELHKNCYQALKKTKITNVILKPLTNVLSMWIYLGFDFIKPLEIIRAKLTFINFLKTKEIISDDEVINYDKMDLKDIIIKHKDSFKQLDFPAFIEKEFYYTNLKKDIL